MLCGDREDTINHIISEKKYKTRYDWMGKVIHRELCKKFKFDHTNKWCMHNQETILENETHKILWDFEIQTDHLISVRQPDRVMFKKQRRSCRKVDFAVPADHNAKLKESEKKDKYLDLAKEVNRRWNMKVMVTPVVIGALSTITKGLINGLEDLGIKE